ncbi:protein-disulfide reductase DsbD [Salinisphaera orenii]|uniref:Thiol:disulfide interchange protein DsbD n=1 Tax=Salinisphaera orenii YIM 95161 TaxID=1051139 RepID=A0A423PHK9_9GAMM|nr:protein-disulfide reductase DsbD [Salinisphaera halophila]ROO25077.1 thiol:disulfide interchange protein [Salinisphaera halophila YIM 95161]
MSAARRPLRRCAWLLVGLWLAVAACAASAADDFLPVDEAFAPTASRADDGAVAVTWAIADTYYLYRHAFEFTFVDAEGARAGEPRIPDGETESDDFFGEVETYRDRMRIEVPTADDEPLPEDARIEVSYQGCADAGLCYPPQTRTLAIADAPAEPPTNASAEASRADATGGAAADESSGAAARGADDGFVAQQDALARRLAGPAEASTLALFLGLGLLLAFTPCILPMIPILSGIVVGSGAGPARAFALSLAYVLAMAAAYTVFGVVAGYFGANLQAALQMPAVLLPFAAVFVLLAAASFGAFDLQMPGAWRQRLGAIGSRRGGLVGAAGMGFFSALIAGPCLAPPLAGALLYISSSGDMWLGGAALFMLGLGMGLPLIVIGTFGARFVPRAGPWMTQVRVFFGVLLLGVALWLASRLVEPVTALAGWGLLALGYGAWLSTAAADSRAGLALRRAVVFLLFVYAGAAAVGVLAGQGRVDRPLAGLTLAADGTADRQQAHESPFTRVDDLAALRAALDRAAEAGRPAVVDFYADWCVECVRMERTTFADARVHEALADVAALQVDVTDYDAGDRRLLRAMDVFGPPTLLFFRADGREAAERRVIGEIDAAEFVRHLQRATGSAP